MALTCSHNSTATEPSLRTTYSLIQPSSLPWISRLLPSWRFRGRSLALQVGPREHGWKTNFALSSRTACDGRHEHNFVAGLHGAAFATEEPNIFLIEIDVQELTDLPLIVADMPGEAGKLCRQNIQRLGNGGRITVKLRRSVGKPPKRSRNFNRNSHFFSLGRRQIFMR